MRGRWRRTRLRMSHLLRASGLFSPDFRGAEPFRSGRYAKLTPYAGGSLVDTIKSQRASGFHGLQMSWKLHKVVRQEIACARAQELMKKGETICQITLRFETLQVGFTLFSIGELGFGLADANATSEPRDPQLARRRPFRRPCEAETRN